MKEIKRRILALLDKMANDLAMPDLIRQVTLLIMGAFQLIAAIDSGKASYPVALTGVEGLEDRLAELIDESE